jgi:RNase adapter protein RapZ
MTERTLVVVVTGLSGAGKSTALHALEDRGFYCVDNMPPPVVATTLEALERGMVTRIALGIDVRMRSFLDGIGDVMRDIATPSREIAILFLDASDEALLRRFSGTRRPHPLSTLAAPGGNQAAKAVLDGVGIERERLAGLRANATVLIDTTRSSVHELRRRVISDFGPGAGEAPRMLTRIVSFGFKYGPPVDADLLFDVRFLRNPYFVDELRPYPGTAEPVRSYVLSDPETAELLEQIGQLLVYCLPRFEREGKSYLTVGIGCTGGQHRSVVIAVELARALGKRLGTAIDVVHRDVERASAGGRGT